MNERLFFLSEEAMDEIELKGYYTSYCYMGWDGKRYIPFASESDYIEHMFAK